MDTNLSELFDQARRIVAEHERRQAEREAMLRAFAQTIDAAFDFTTREKSELDPRMDIMEGRGVLQFVVQGYHAIFLLSEGDGRRWGLQAAEEGHPLELLAEIEGGSANDLPSRRLAAARLICAIGDWVSRHEPAPALELVKQQEEEVEVPELAAVGAPAPMPMQMSTAAISSSAVPLSSVSIESNGNGSGRRPPPPVPQFGKSFGY